MENRRNVIETYDIIAEWFSKNRFEELTEKPCLDKLIEFAGNGGSVLDIGCGTGKPIMAYLLSQGMHVTGVDGSSRILEIARHNFPFVHFIHADMRELSLNRKFDAVMAWHSFFHLPMEDQPAMFGIFKAHLKDKGVLLFTSGKERGEAWGMNGGENLFHASLDSQDYRSLLEEHGFRVLVHKEDDAECAGATVWLAQLAG